MAASSSASRHAATASPRSVASSSVHGARGRARRARGPRGVEVRRVELAAREDDRPRRGTRPSAARRRRPRCRPPGASRTTTSVAASVGGDARAARIEVEHAPQADRVTLGAARRPPAARRASARRASSTSHHASCSGDAPTHSSVSVIACSGSMTPVASPRQLDHRAAHAQPLERARDVEDRLAEDAVAEAAARAQAEDEHLLEGHVRLARHEQRLARLARHEARP